MTPRWLQQKTYVARSKIHGWGLFADRHINAGVVIEESPVLRCTGAVPSVLRERVLEDGDGWALPFGNFPLVNSSDDPSAEWHLDRRRPTVILTALRSVYRDEEITIDYAETV